MNHGGMFITGSVMNSALVSDYNSFHAFYVVIGIDLPGHWAQLSEITLA